MLLRLCCSPGAGLWHILQPTTNSNVTMKPQASPKHRRRALRQVASPEGLAITTLVCAAGNLAAQTAPAPATPAPANTTTTVAPEVVVTGALNPIYKPQTVES